MQSSNFGLKRKTGTSLQEFVRLRPSFVWTDDGFKSDLDVVIGLDGRVDRIEPRSLEGTPPTEGGSATTQVELPYHALVPGQVNSHSHGFQRSIRGRTHRSTGVSDDFWSWRNAMHAATMRVDPKSLFQVSRYVFMEMLEAGYTSVGDFHYVHLQPDGTPYDNANAMAGAIVEAAEAVGIRLVLLRTAYLHAGFDDPEPTDGQRRFMEPSSDVFIERTEALLGLARSADSGLVSVGIAPHSVRAVHPRELRQLSSWARQAGVPLHIHASEQTAEVEGCLAAHGRRPIELLDECDVLSGTTSIVHATHLVDTEIQLLADADCTVVVCPTTEADLGDGLVRASDLVRAGIPLSIGSDSNAYIDPFYELRSLELHERLRTRRRTCLSAAAGTSHTGPVLLRVGTENGARALGLESGRIEAGQWADLAAVDLRCMGPNEPKREELSDVIAMHAAPHWVTHAWVAGRPVLNSGLHPDHDEIAEAAARAFATLRGTD